ncbi:MAG: hypothetical protein R3F23_09495 [Verrucomicrobiia bacterium]
MGNQAQAQGNASFAAGNASQAQGKSAIAMGEIDLLKVVVMLRRLGSIRLPKLRSDGGGSL